MATINNLENGYNKVQINTTLDKAPDGTVIRKSVMINLREETAEKCWKLYSELQKLLEKEEKKTEKENKRTDNVKVKKEMPKCECGNPMVLRNGRNGPFFGCSAYPSCRLTRRYQPEESIETIDVKEIPF